jgi:hypothetical protein
MTNFTEMLERRFNLTLDGRMFLLFVPFLIPIRRFRHVNRLRTVTA